MATADETLTPRRDPDVEARTQLVFLFIAGNESLNFSGADKQKLRQYVEEGGLIVGHADCSTAAFASSFKKLGSELFPTYEFRDLTGLADAMT